MAEIIFCGSPTEFESILNTHASSEAKSVYIYFTGSKNKDTGLSWCGDCTRASPVIENLMRTVEPGTKFIICDVEREEYRTPEYFYRNFKDISLRCVPTLICWRNGKVILRLNDSQCQNTDIVNDFMESSFTS